VSNYGGDTGFSCISIRGVKRRAFLQLNLLSYKEEFL
jgi:hypothetical protein